MLRLGASYPYKAFPTITPIDKQIIKANTFVMKIAFLALTSLLGRVCIVDGMVDENTVAADNIGKQKARIAKFKSASYFSLKLLLSGSPWII